MSMVTNHLRFKSTGERLAGMKQYADDRAEIERLQREFERLIDLRRLGRAE